MKKRIKFLCAFLVCAFIFSACKKEENKVYFEGGTAPVLSSSATTPLVLNAANKADVALTLSWTNPDYKFNTGISSQDVSYALQIDTTGSNFTNPNIVEKSFAKDLSTSITVGDLNVDMTLLLLAENVPHNLEARVRSSLTNNAAPLYSNVIKFIATPYLDVAVAVPATGKLFITGSATAGSWQATGDPELLSQQFTRVSNTLYQITLPLNGGGSYKLVPQYGSWTKSYGSIGADNSNNSNGDNFKDGGNNLLGPAVSGNYKITVDFKLGKFTVTKV